MKKRKNRHTRRHRRHRQQGGQRTRSTRRTTRPSSFKSLKTSKAWKDLKCSAGKREHAFTCYSTDTLMKMKHLWNARHPDLAITSNSPKAIWEALKEYMEPTCTQERCWMEQHFMKGGVDKSIKDFTFAPKAPDTWKKNPDEWLSSIDIMRVMSQYEHEYPCFEFLGPSPIDYDTKKLYGECVWDELCTFSLETYLKKGIRKFGIIFNLDPHYKEGSHWVALYIHVPKEYLPSHRSSKMRLTTPTTPTTPKAGIYYFDSYGEKVEPEIKKFMNTVKKQANALHIPISLKENTRRHQYSESECGVFSMYFILRMLFADGDPELAKDVDKMFSKVSLEKKIPDKHMKAMRKQFFNWE